MTVPCRTEKPSDKVAQIEIQPTGTNVNTVSSARSFDDRYKRHLSIFGVLLIVVLLVAIIWKLVIFVKYNLPLESHSKVITAPDQESVPIVTIEQLY